MAWTNVSGAPVIGTVDGVLITSGGLAVLRADGYSFVNQASGEAFARTASDSTAVVDVASRAVSVARTAISAVGVSDATARSSTSARFVSDGVVVVDFARRAGGSARAEDSFLVSDNAVVVFDEGAPVAMSSGGILTTTNAMRRLGDSGTQRLQLAGVA